MVSQAATDYSVADPSLRSRTLRTHKKRQQGGIQWCRALQWQGVDKDDQLLSFWQGCFKCPSVQTSLPVCTFSSQVAGRSHARRWLRQEAGTDRQDLDVFKEEPLPRCGEASAPETMSLTVVVESNAQRSLDAKSSLTQRQLNVESDMDRYTHLEGKPNKDIPIHQALWSRPRSS